jgi:uncharacterized damage-inducible protein DinB
MKRISIVLVTALALAAPAYGQMASPAGAVATSKSLWQDLTGYITTAAEELPESLYAYKPTPEVRSFGQLFAHVAGAQYMFCALALGEPNRAEIAIETPAKTKAEIVAGLKASTEYCNRAYAQTDAAAAAPAQIFGQDRTRLFALAQNATHNGEHYGNIVTYLRINGIVPPSSRGR